MELNLIATGIELLGASVAKLTVDNTIVDIENDAQRSFGMTINEPQFQNIEKTKEIFSQMTIDFDIIIFFIFAIASSKLASFFCFCASFSRLSSSFFSCS